MGRWSEPGAGLFALSVLALWRWGYPVTSWAALPLVPAFLVIAAGIRQRRILVTRALRDAMFRPASRIRHWFTGRFTGLVIAIVESFAICLGMSYFTLRATAAELWLALGTGLATLAAMALLRARLAPSLRPGFALIGASRVAAAAALPFCLAHIWLQIHSPLAPAYLQAGGFLDVLTAALDDLPSHRDGIIEALAILRLLDALSFWSMEQLGNIRGIEIIFFTYNAALYLAVARFAADIACAFNAIAPR